MNAVLHRLVGICTTSKVWAARPASRMRIAETLDLIRPRIPEKRLVRIGGDGDGGYLVPDDFDGITHCISPGVSDMVDFDTHLAQKGIVVSMVDGSVEGPPRNCDNFVFKKKFLGWEDSDSHIRLSTLCDEIPRESTDMLLQMDIEGAEWECLLDTDSSNLKRFRIIIVEFHAMHQIFSDWPQRMITTVLRKLASTHHPVHVHPNNSLPAINFNGISIPPLLEVTYLRKDRGFKPGFATEFPHPLDQDCVPTKPVMAVEGLW